MVLVNWWWVGCVMVLWDQEVFVELWVVYCFIDDWWGQFGLCLDCVFSYVWC